MAGRIQPFYILFGSSKGHRAIRNKVLLVLLCILKYGAELRALFFCYQCSTVY